VHRPDLLEFGALDETERMVLFESKVLDEAEKMVLFFAVLAEFWCFLGLFS